jgi:hypothetical protein
MPSPPADLTPAMATLLLTERTSDRTVSAGLVDLAARGCIAFEAEGKHPDGTRTGVKYLGAGKGDMPAARGRRARRHRSQEREARRLHWPRPGSIS